MLLSPNVIRFEHDSTTLNHVFCVYYCRRLSSDSHTELGVTFESRKLCKSYLCVQSHHNDSYCAIHTMLKNGVMMAWDLRLKTHRNKYLSPASHYNLTVYSAPYSRSLQWHFFSDATLFFVSLFFFLRTFLFLFVCLYRQN